MPHPVVFTSFHISAPTTLSCSFSQLCITKQQRCNIHTVVLA